MRIKYFGIMILAAMLLVLASVSLGLAQSQLIVVRAADDSLWKATCTGSTCGAFSMIAGRLRYPPALTWNEDIQRYVLIGVAGDSTIWKATFSRVGSFYNDWTNLPGLAASPVATAGGNVTSNFDISFSDTDTTLTTVSTVYNVRSVNMLCPMDGYILTQASGYVDIYDGGNRTELYLVETSGTRDTTYENQVYIPDGLTATTNFQIPFALSKYFSCPAGGGYKTVYLTAERTTGTSTSYVRDAQITATYHPYKY